MHAQQELEARILDFLGVPVPRLPKDEQRIKDWDMAGKKFYIIEKKYEDAMRCKAVAGVAYARIERFYMGAMSLDRASKSAHVLHMYEPLALFCEYAALLYEKSALRQFTDAPFFVSDEDAKRNRAFAHLRISESYVHLLRMKEACEHFHRADNLFDEAGFPKEKNQFYCSVAGMVRKEQSKLSQVA